MGGSREEEEGGDEGVLLGWEDLEFSFRVAAVFFFFTVSHCSSGRAFSTLTSLEHQLEKWSYS